MVKQSWESQMIDGVFPTRATKELKDNSNDLILKDTFELGSNGKRTNTMKLRPMPDGSIQIWVKNGYIRHAAFRLQVDTIAELRWFLNKHHQASVEAKYDELFRADNAKLGFGDGK